MPKYKTIEEAMASEELFDYVEIPMEYYPGKVGPGGFSPKTMYLNALARQNGLLNDYETKSWIMLWLLDHVDWSKVEGTNFESH